VIDLSALLNQSYSEALLGLAIDYDADPIPLLKFETVNAQAALVFGDSKARTITVINRMA